MRVGVFVIVGVTVMVGVIVTVGVGASVDLAKFVGVEIGLGIGATQLVRRPKEIREYINCLISPSLYGGL